MADVVERKVEVTQYQVTLDEQEMEIFRKIPEFIRRVLDDNPHLLEFLREANDVGEIVWKVIETSPDDLPEWWPEEQRWQVAEERLTAEQIVELAGENHMWLNAFSCVSPSPEFLQEIGQMVVTKLNQSHLRTNGFGEPDARGRKAGESPLVYLRINKS